MSTSSPLAVTMMIGTWLSVRIRRHASSPLIPGSIRSSTTTSGRNDRS
jgi:hypothetical protein